MKNFAWLVAYSIPMVLAGLLCGTAIVSIGFGLSTLIWSEESFSNLALGSAFGLWAFIFAFMLGLIPALLYGATSYAFLVRMKRASYFTSAILGCIPGLILLILDRSFGMLFIAFGAPVACCTHFFALQSPALQRFSAKKLTGTHPEI